MPVVLVRYQPETRQNLQAREIAATVMGRAIGTLMIRLKASGETIGTARHFGSKALSHLFQISPVRSHAYLHQ